MLFHITHSLLFLLELSDGIMPVAYAAGAVEPIGLVIQSGQPRLGLSARVEGQVPGVVERGEDHLLGGTS